MHRLIAVAHGTASVAGRTTVAALADAVRSARPDIPVDQCFLDVVEPRLDEVLSRVDGAPSVVVPMLLSTGFHVQSDIPQLVAGHPDASVARHLGPHPLLADALADALAALPGPGASVVLVGAGSSRSEAAAELADAATLLTARLGRPVSVTTLGDDLAEVLRAAEPPVHVATYLLAEGTFTSTLRAVAEQVGDVHVAAPLGTHPAVVELVWRRYDEAVQRARVL